MQLRAALGALVLAFAFGSLAGGCADAETAGPRDAGTSSGSGARPSSGSRASLPGGDDTTVTRVVDGDTLVVERGDERVRLIGIDTPETKDPRASVQCFGREAAERTAALLPPGTPVRLVYDVERVDRYGRTLAYVYRRSDGVFVNAALVREGYASAYTYPPNVAHADELVGLQREARAGTRGLWRACDQEQPVPGSTAPTGDACDPAYPDVCLPPSPPDLDCADITARRFRVVAPDPHRFDGGGDGVGCEGP